MSKGFDSVLRLGVTLPVVLAGLAIGQSAVAQDDTAIFEEIVVTVQRREQSIMDVPVAVSALSGEQIQAAGIKDMFDLQQNVVGLIVGQSQTSTSTNFSIRGVGSTANNFGVESSVGMYVDGVYRSRQSSLVNDLADIETVEIARGPQGTLFGKNTASGAIIMRTRRPSQDREGFIDVTAGDHGLVKLSAASNFSLTDNVAMRGTVFMSQRDGYVDDVVFGDDFYNDRDRWGARLQLGVNELGDDFNMRIIADYAEIDETCCVAVSQVDGLVSQASLTSPGGPVFGSDAAIMQLGGLIFTDFPYPPGFFPPNVRTGVGFEDYVVSYDSKPNSTNEDLGLSVEFNKGLGDSTTLTSITAYRTFDTFDTIDADFTSLPLISRINEAELESISQELRISGEFGEGSNYVVGAYYFGQEIDTETFTGDPSGALGLLGTYIGAIQPQLGDAVTLVDTISGLVGPPYPPAGIPFTPGVFARDTVNQDQDGWAVFGQVDWSITDAFTLTLGMRYTDETKKINSTYVQSAQGPAPDLNALGLIGCQLDQPPGCFATLPPPLQQPPNFADPATLNTIIPFSFDDWGSYLFPPLAPRPDLQADLSDDQTTGTVKLSWFPSDSTMIYASYASGFKSGGTNVDRISPAFDPIFGAETSESYELGVKAEWGAVQVKAAIYDVTYDDFQAQTFTGTGFNLQNAGKLSTEGFELEMLWRPTDSTEVQINYAHNEGEYDDFTGGTCWDTYVFHTGIADPGSGGDPTAEVCDRTGFEIPYNPEDRAFVALTQDVELSNTMSMFIRGEYSYTSSQFTDGDLDPFTKQDSFEIVNVRLGINFDNIASTLTLWGRNITDERYFHGSFDQPIGLGRMNSYPAEPATYGVSFLKNFD
jgi:outer membrane receptor protein involved in Fe transport